MKRVLFLLLITVSAISVSAQREYRNNDRDGRYHYKHDRKKGIDRRQGSGREAYKRQLMSINNHYDSKVLAVKQNRFINRNQKNRRIRDIEMERRVALKQARDRFARQRDFAFDR